MLAIRQRRTDDGRLSHRRLRRDQECAVPHCASPRSNSSGNVVGRTVSRIDSGNIAGSTLGLLATAFYLLDRFSIEECLMWIGTLTLLLGGTTALAGDKRRWRTVPLVVCRTDRAAAAVARAGHGRTDRRQMGSTIDARLSRASSGTSTSSSTRPMTRCAATSCSAARR